MRDAISLALVVLLGLPALASAGSAGTSKPTFEPPRGVYVGTAEGDLVNEGRRANVERGSMSTPTRRGAR